MAERLIDNNSAYTLQETRMSGVMRDAPKLPFVYVYERADSTITVRGANIYAEHIRHALMHKSLQKKVTGKFTMIKKEDEKMNEYFEVNAELKKTSEMSGALRERIQRIIVDTLRKFNSEYEDQYRSVPRIMTPPVVLRPYQDAVYFAVGVKQKWAKK